MPRHTTSFAPARALLGAPYPLPNLIRRETPPPPPPPSSGQTQLALPPSTPLYAPPAPTLTDDPIAQAAQAVGLPYDPNWRNRQPACPPIPYPPLTPEEAAESRRRREIRREIRRMRRAIRTSAGYEVPFNDHDDMEDMEVETGPAGSFASTTTVDYPFIQNGSLPPMDTLANIELAQMDPAAGPSGTPSMAVPHLQPPAEIFPNPAVRQAPAAGMPPLPGVYHTPQNASSFQEHDLGPGDTYFTPAGSSTLRAEEDEVDSNISPSVSIPRRPNLLYPGNIPRYMPVTTAVVTPHRSDGSNVTSPTTSVSLAEILLEQLWTDEEKDVMTTLDAMSAGSIAEARGNQRVQIPRARHHRLRKRLESLPGGSSSSASERSSPRSQGESSHSGGEQSSSAIREMNVDDFRRSVRFNKTTVVVASERLRSSTSTPRPEAGPSRDPHTPAPDPSSSTAHPSTPDAVEEEVEEPMYSAMSIDPATADGQQASWPHPLPPRERGAGNETDGLPQPAEYPLDPNLRPVGVQPPQFHAPPPSTSNPNADRPPVHPIFRRLHIPPPPSPFSMGVVVQYQHPPIISGLTRGLVVPSAPRTRTVVMPQLKACQNFLLARRCQTHQRKTTRDHNLAVFVLAQQQGKKLVILNDPPAPLQPPPAVRRVVYRPITHLPPGPPGTMQPRGGGPSQHGHGPPPNFAGGVHAPRVIPTFFQPGQALYPMNAVGSYIQPVPNPFYGNQPYIPPQQSDANVFLHSRPTPSSGAGPSTSPKVPPTNDAPVMPPPSSTQPLPPESGPSTSAQVPPATPVALEAGDQPPRHAMSDSRPTEQGVKRKRYPSPEDGTSYDDNGAHQVPDTGAGTRARKARARNE